MTKKLIITDGGITLQTDGYVNLNGGVNLTLNDGYHHEKQLNIKLTELDMNDILDIKQEFFDNEITNSTLGRILIRRGIKSFKNLK